MILLATQDFQKGETVTYEKEVMFKGIENVTAKIVAISRSGLHPKLLLDNGDTITVAKPRV